MSRRCDYVSTNLYLFLDKEVGWVRKTVISLHLRRCHDCTDRIEFERNLRIVVRERVREEPRPEMVDRLRRYLQDQEPDFGSGQ